MKSLAILSPAQNEAISHIYETGETYLVGQMGSGKTVTALAAANELLINGVVKRVLVVAPVRVCNDVWRKEHLGWEELRSMRVSIATGSKPKRMAALESGANIVAINFECLEWLFTDPDAKKFKFDMLIVDEVTKLKAGGVAFKRLRPRIKDFKVRVTMTGTPVAESFLDLFYPMMVVDNGAAFGKNRMHWLERHFMALDWERRNWQLRHGEALKIMSKMADALVILPDYTDELPELIIERVLICLAPRAQAKYDELERFLLLEDEEVTPVNAAVLTGKLQQVASGFVYTDKGEVVEMHDSKIGWLKNHYLTVQPTVFVYQFKEELRRLRKMYPCSGVLGVSAAVDAATLASFRAGHIKELLLHPKSAGHGLDLTVSHHMVIMSPIWSRDLMRQTIARIWRRNQKNKCYVRVLMAHSTIDVDIVAREEGKGEHMDLMKKAVDRLESDG